MHFHIITLFPESFTSYLNESILARAQKEKKIKISFYNPRDFACPTEAARKRAKAGQADLKPYLRVDDKPFGGGPGMVIQAEPVLKAIAQVKKKIKSKKIKIIHLSPVGEKFTNAYATASVKKFTDLIIICGRYEGIDARVKKICKGDELSVGEFTLTGGELPAMLMIDAISRQVEGVLGNFNSVEESRAASHDVYTRPEVLSFNKKNYKVPKVLLSGNHKLIEEWRKSGKINPHGFSSL